MTFGFTRTVVAFLIVLFGVIILLMMSAVGNTIQQTTRIQATVAPFLACRFNNTTPSDIPVYSAPFSAEMLEIDTLADSVQALVITLRDTHVLVRIRGNYSGWVARDLGVLTGDCNLPEDQTPLTSFATICFYRPTERTTLYTTTDLQEPIQSLIPDESYVIIGQSETAYHIRINNFIAGYADKNKGLTRGACGLVPIEG
ncbi:MAG: hypothetical protein CUN52_04610 [Phototrophicales bacterium]|nr:MAG: hypothetical protein CUN52_04610 [Phototrophicales bacterium]